LARIGCSKGRIVELQRYVIAGFLAGALQPAPISAGLVAHGVEHMDAEVRRVLRIGRFGRDDNDVLV
jgi:hypothetical protein